jgi:hypothetical protein
MSKPKRLLRAGLYFLLGGTIAAIGAFLIPINQRIAMIICLMGGLFSFYAIFLVAVMILKFLTDRVNQNRG